MYHIDTWLRCCFHEYCLLVVIISFIWDVTIILCFVEPLVAQHYSHWRFLALMELPRWPNIICLDMRVPTFGWAVHFNPWYVDFISGLRSCENKPPHSLLNVELLSLLWTKTCKWSHWKTFLWPTVFRWAVMLCFMAKPSALVILCGVCSWKNICGGHKWHSTLK